MCIRDRVKGIGPQLAEALCYIGLLTKEDVRVHVTMNGRDAVSYTHLRAHETVLDLVCRLLLEKKKKPHLPA